MDSNARKRIFISHSTIDAPIGEKFLDAITDLGIDKDDVFYSSKYHTGVKLGKDFHQEVKEALHNCDIVIFLLTRSFYKSEFCINEMGAVWYSNKRFIPILLDNLTFDNMKGFIDSHYVAFKPQLSESYKLLTALSEFITNSNEIKDLETVFNDFVITANSMAEMNAKLLPEETNSISNTEKMILNNRFTEGEILLLNYFVEIQDNELNDRYEYDHENENEIESEDLIQINEYSSKYNFNYAKAKSLLSKSKLLDNYYEEFNDSYIGCELKIDIFRDLLSLTDKGKDLIETIKTKYEVAIPTINLQQQETIPFPNSEPKNLNDIERIILNTKFKELDALLFRYMIDTSTVTLGDRWMAEGQKNDIKKWEDINNLNNKLSSNYETALKSLIFRKLVEPSSFTSYGNPREYKLKDEYATQLSTLNLEAESVLNTVVKNNIFEIPF